MKFVHIGDLHLGKVLHQYSLLQQQRELLFQLLEYMDRQDIRTLVIAGDVYDRLIPSQEAVNLLDEFLNQAILNYHIRILMISGNHDSSDRMHFVSSLLSHSGLYIETYVDKEMKYVEIDGVRFYLLPFMKPSVVKALYNEDNIHTYQEAFEYYMSKQTLDKSYKNILVTHQFVGRNSLTSESEMPISVGGSEIIDASLFDDFDYVALGHLHAPQKVSRETIRYSGSLMRYSFDEVKQNKSIVIVDTETMNISFHELTLSRTLQKYTGSFQDFMNPDFISNKEDYLAFELSDSSLVPHAIEQLRIMYPYLLQLTYSFITKANTQTNFYHESIEKMDTLSLFSKFYQDMKNQELTETQKQYIQKILEQVGEEDESH